MMFKRNVRKRPGVLAKEKARKQLARQDPKFKANELVHQRSSKQSARKKQLARQDPNFKANELVHQRSSKQLARQDP